MKFRWWYSLRKSDKLSASWSVFLLTTWPEATFFCHSLIFALLLLPFTDFIFKASNLTVCLIKLRLKFVALDLSCLAIRFERIRLLSKCRKLRAKCRYWRTLSNIEIESVDQRFQRPSHRSQSNRPIASSKSQLPKFGNPPLCNSCKTCKTTPNWSELHELHVLHRGQSAKSRSKVSKE